MKAEKESTGTVLLEYALIIGWTLWKFFRKSSVTRFAASQVGGIAGRNEAAIRVRQPPARKSF